MRVRWAESSWTVRLSLCLCVVVMTTIDSASTAFADGGDVLLESPYQGIGPYGITRDASDGSFWVPSVIDGEVRHFDAALNLLGDFPNPFVGTDGSSGIAYYPTNDSLLMVHHVTHQLLEVDKTGIPVPGGVDAPLQTLPVVNPLGQPILRGMAYYANGDSGQGSVFVVESVGSLVYEFDLFGNVLSTFVHPDDPDGYPGMGSGAPAGGIDLVLDPLDNLIGFDLVGEFAGERVVHRLEIDGSLTGLHVPLVAVGVSTVSGIVRTTFVDPQTGDLFDAIYGTNESSAALFVVDGSLPPIAELLDFTCEAQGESISLTWDTAQAYDTVRLFRNGTLVQTFPGTTTAFLDDSLAHDVYEYQLIADAGTLSTQPRACTDVIGAGQVLAYEVMQDVYFPIDITEDDSQILWITDNDNVVWAYDKSPAFIASFTGPFVEEDDDLTGIAYRASTNTLFLYNAFDHAIQEVDLSGTPVASEFIAQIPIPDPDNPPWVGSLLYNPNGDLGNGELIALELAYSTVYRLRMDGSIIDSFTLPEELHYPTPTPSYIGHYDLGLSSVPEIGDGFQVIDTGSGSVFDQRITRFIRLDLATGAPTGYQMPTDGVRARIAHRWACVHNTTYFGEPVAMTIALRTNNSYLFRVRRDVPPVLPVDFLECHQTGLVDEVLIEFSNYGPYDAIELLRDGAPLVTLSGSASSYLDQTAPPGLHEYTVIPVTAGVEARPKRCSLRVGVGAILARRFAFPLVSPYQMTRSASDGSFLLTSNSASIAENYYRFDSDLNFVETVPSAVENPFQVSCFAIRPAPGGDEVWSISWEVRAPWLMPQTLLLTVQDAADGSFIQPPEVIDIPGAGVGVSLTYVTGMSYDASDDTFWFLERNTDTIWQMDTAGELLQSISNPLPPLQDFVFNLGMQAEPARGTLTVTTADEFDHKITATQGVSYTGQPTGERVDLDDARLSTIYGMVRDNERLWVTGSVGSIGQILEIKAGDSLAFPSNVTCVEDAPLTATLSWIDPVAYDEVVIRRSGLIVAIVAGGVETYVDTGVPVGSRTYTVSGRVGDEESTPVACSLTVAGGGPTFLRGDATADGALDISDAVFALAYLFAMGPDPLCFDAADANDSGVFDITDPIYTLSFLFTAGPQPPLPFPDLGGDPTGDSLGCDL